MRLWFEDGKVVREEATKGERYLSQMLDIDEGARYLGEVAFGMNDEIQSGTRDTLFDEKIGGTCHVALGMAFPEAGGRNALGPALGHGLRPTLRRRGARRRRSDLPRRAVPMSDPRVERLADVIVNYSTSSARATWC